ncbi:MAG: hypothetical protein ACUVXA_11080 [Candidatus Jordarchaeum sp.]|uniref:hypothetical protein n=1 Tax=Candidatus Jordarchaeum sp. TaxID=2823881 RepID=UPI00404B0E41
MGKDKRVEEALKRLEQGIEKIAEVFDQYTETVRQEMAFVNQKITDLESRIDGIESWSSFAGEGGETRPRVTPRPTPLSKASVLERYTPPTIEEYTPAVETHATRPSVSEAETGYMPSTPTRQPTRRTIEHASFVTKEDLGIGGPSRDEGAGGYRPIRGGIVEEKFVKPSVFAKEMNKLHDQAVVATQTPYGPGGYTPPPSMQLRQEVSRVLGKIRPEAQIRVPRPSPVQEYGPGSSTGYQAPSGPAYMGDYGPPQAAAPAYSTEPAPAPGPSGETKSISVPDNWLPESSRAKYYNPKKLKKGDIKEMEKKTKDIFK